MSPIQRKLVLLFLYMLMGFYFTPSAFSQSIFESSDFATLTDSFTVSKISLLDIPNYDYDMTGAGVTWDYSSFVPVSQIQKKFTDPDYTGFRTAYFFSCNTLCYGNCYNTCVGSGGFPLICAGSCNFSCGSTCLNNWITKFDLAELTSDSVNLIITSIQDIFNFYDLSQDALSQIAVGAKLSGFPIVLEYQNPDRIYAFPMEYDNRDTSFSNYSLQLDSIPGTGIVVSFLYSHRQQRYNHVEGWGTLKTPYGIFDNVLKLKSVIESQDTVIVQGNTLPLNIISQNLVEYKWFSPDYGIPLLKVTARIINGSTIYQDLEFIDSIRCFNPFAVFGYQPFPAVINQGEQDVEIGFFSLSVNGDDFSWNFGDSSSSQNTGSGTNATHVYSEGGVYNVQLSTCNSACSSPICDTFSLPVLIIDLSDDSVSGIPFLEQMSIDISPNPFDEKVLLNVSCTKDEKMKLVVYDLTGKLVFVLPYTHFRSGSHYSEIDLSKLPAGVYVAEAETEDYRQVFKLTKTPYKD